MVTNHQQPRQQFGSAAGLCAQCQRNHHDNCSGFRRGNHGLKPRCWCVKCREKNDARRKTE